MGDYLGPSILLLTAVVVVGALQGLHRMTALDPSAHLVTPFLSGWAPEEHALSRFHARWYPVTLVFVAFDVEMLFMYPWAVIVGSVGVKAIIEMFVFLGVLMAAVFWAWREGALRWV